MKPLTDEQIMRIRKTVEVSGVGRIVLIDISGDKDEPLKEHNKNIYCIKQDGNILWQVQADATIYDRDSFVHLSKDDRGIIHAHRFFGNEFVIDPNTGKAELTGWHK
ncbi:MAG: hypothetical protein PHI97_30675 [Desulfobulbus sp.]|nr:hypothetical protein [Desulfobulbus sp.]